MKKQKNYYDQLSDSGIKTAQKAAERDGKLKGNPFVLSFFKFFKVKKNE